METGSGISFSFHRFDGLELEDEGKAVTHGAWIFT